MLKLINLRQNMNCDKTDDLSEWDKSSSTSDNCADDFWEDTLNVAIKRYLPELLWLVNIISVEGGRCDFDLLVQPVERKIPPDEHKSWIDYNLREFDHRWKGALTWIETQKKSEKKSEKRDNKRIQRLNDFLLDLNYLSQEGEVATNVNGLRGAGISLIEVSAPPRNLRMQKWMLYRLLHKIPALRSSRSNIHSINLNFNTMMRGADTSFKDLFSRDGDSGNICDAMSKPKPVLFSVCGMENLYQNKLDFFIKGFLDELNDRISEHSNISGNKCIVILIGGAGWTAKHNRCSLWSPPISWGDLDMNDLDNWFLTQPSKENITAGEFLNELAIAKSCESLPPSDSTSWRAWIDIGSSHQTVSSICNKFLGTEDINKLNAIWSKEML